MPSLRERLGDNPARSSPARAMQPSVFCKRTSAPLWEVVGSGRLILEFAPRFSRKEWLAHAEELAVTSALPVTAALGKEKQPCEREGLLDTVKEIVPV